MSQSHHNKFRFVAAPRWLQAPAITFGSWPRG